MRPGLLRYLGAILLLPLAVLATMACIGLGMIGDDT
jgi:hypothetical protein